MPIAEGGGRWRRITCYCWVRINIESRSWCGSGAVRQDTYQHNIAEDCRRQAIAAAGSRRCRGRARSHWGLD